MNALIRPHAVGLLALTTVAVLAAQVVLGPFTALPTRSDGPRSPRQEEQAGCLPPPASMIGWWPFDGTEPSDSGGGDWYRDMAGIVNVAEPAGNLTTTSGYVAGAITLNGVDQFVRVAAHPELAFGTGNFSIDAWIRIGDDMNASAGRHPIVDKSELGPMDQPLGYTLFVENGHLGFSMSGVNGPLANVVSQATIGAGWQFIAVTVVRSPSPAGGVGTLYINGSAAESFVVGPGVAAVDNEAELLIGADSLMSGGQGNHYFWGGIDEVELFRRALTADEILAIYSHGIEGKCKAPPTPTPDALKGADPTFMGNEALVNIDVINQCGVDAHGFRFVLSDFGGGSVSIPPNYYSFSKVFEVSCQPPSPGASPPNPCNPFTPSLAVPAYTASTITLGWQSASAILGAGGSAHFGYSLWPATGHSIKAELMSGPTPGSGPTSICESMASSTTWSAINTTTVTMTVQNQSSNRMELALSGTALRQRISLEGLVPSNAALMRSLGAPQTNAVLGPGERLSITLETGPDAMAAVVLADWYAYDGQRGPIQARAFFARALRASAAPPRTGLSLPWVGSAPWPPELNAPGGN
jgi:hypothetical protein